MMEDHAQFGFSDDFDHIDLEGFEFGAIGVIRYDVSGNAFSIDAGAVNVLDLNVDPETFSSCPAAELFTSAPDHADSINEAIASGQVCDRELELTTLNGERKYLQCDFYLMNDEETGADFVHVVYRDITRQHSAEESHERSSKKRNLLLDMAHHLTSSLDVNEVLTRIADGSRRILRADSCTIFTITDGELHPVTSLSSEHQQAAPETVPEAAPVCPLDIDSAVARRAFKTEDCIVINNSADAETYTAEVRDGERIIALPFIVEDETFGVMYLSRMGEAFEDEDVTLAQVFAAYAGTALNNARTYDRLQHEVSERIKAEEALRQSEERNRAMLTAIPDTMFRLSRDGIVLDYKAAAVSISQIPHEEIINRSLEDIGIRKEFARKLREAIHLVLQSGRIRTQDIEVDLPSGVRHIEARVVPSGADEAVVIARDMTDLRRTMIALDESRKRFSQFYYNAQVGLFRSNLSDGRITVCNQRCAQIYGYKDRVQFMAEYIAGDHYVDPGTRDRMLKILDEEGEIQNFESRMTRRDGSLVWVRTSARLLREEGSLEGVIGDVTEQKEGEEKRRRLQEHIEQSQKLESLGKLAGGMAHHFNNLLQGIYGNADMALLELPEGSKVRSHIEEIQSTSQKAAELSNQMLAYSGKGKFLVKEIDIDTQLEEMRNLLLVSAPRAVGVRWELHGDLPIIKGDPSQISQVVMNLVSNAWEAMDESGGIVTLITGVRDCDQDFLKNTYLGQNAPRGTYVFLTVKDNGEGMDEATSAKIFDPFFSTRGTGRGLGLAAVLGIVRGHQGTIQVQSRPRIGTSITVYFPSEIAMGNDVPSETESHPPRSVLLVAQDKMVLTITARMLKTLEFDVLMASSEDKAINLYTENRDRIAVTFIDTDIQPKGGEEVIHFIRETDAEAPIMVASGYADQSILNRLGDQRFSAFIQKPFQLEALREKAYRLLSPPDISP